MTEDLKIPILSHLNLTSKLIDSFCNILINLSIIKGPNASLLISLLISQLLTILISKQLTSVCSKLVL